MVRRGAALVNQLLGPIGQKVRENSKSTRQQQKCIDNAEKFLRPRELAVKNKL
jgi:hypothetical protein